MPSEAGLQPVARAAVALVEGILWRVKGSDGDREDVYWAYLRYRLGSLTIIGGAIRSTKVRML